MTQSIIDSLIGSAPFSFVSDYDGNSYFKDLKIVSVEIDQACAVARDPISMEQVTETETYVSLLDADIKSGKILRPSAMRITALVANVSTMESLIRAYADVTLTFTVTSKAIISDYMCITSLEVTQSGEVTSANRVVIELEQTAPTVVGNYDPSNPADESTYGIRIQAPPTVLASAVSAVSSLSSNAQALYNKVSSSVSSLL